MYSADAPPPPTSFTYETFVTSPEKAWTTFHMGYVSNSGSCQSLSCPRWQHVDKYNFDPGTTRRPGVQGVLLFLSAQNLLKHLRTVNDNCKTVTSKPAMI